MSLRPVRYLARLVAACTVLVGCVDKNGPTTRPASVRERQEQALRDPFEYGPEDEHPSVSGDDSASGPGRLDRKGLKRDWDRFWNP